ncbi:MAG: Unknown protein [uncultured Sulfurovum sp.]|uniref:Periplasmic protein related to spheroblast formation n=1 Tax=uncultured Sulfurovum sp. TaxID=269237 RepID=A0A6S6T5A7_9BACT|nr:MAG: Unknown protein [uncultured Sulfurovum sp.]
MKVLKTLAIVTISGIMATTAVSANDVKENCKSSSKCERGAKHHKGGMMKMKAALKAAEITSEQKRAIREVRKEMKQTMKAKRAEMKASGEKPVKRGEFRESMKAEMMEKVLAILTPEQQTKFVQALGKPRK